MGLGAGPGWGEQRVAVQLDCQSQHGESNNQSIPGQCGCRDVRVWLLYHPFLHSTEMEVQQSKSEMPLGTSSTARICSYLPSIFFT